LGNCKLKLTTKSWNVNHKTMAIKSIYTNEAWLEWLWFQL